MLEFKAGDKAAFEKLMRKYYPRILNFIYRFMGNRTVAEDLTQEVFMRIYKAAAAYKPRSLLQTWIYVIAKNVCLNEMRRKKDFVVSLDDRPNLSEGSYDREPQDSSTPSPDAELMQKERKSIIKSAIDSLPPNQRIAVILRRYDDFSYDQIARTLNISNKAVKSLLNRAKENLKVRLADMIKED